jgi:hypothetical protein
MTQSKIQQLEKHLRKHGQITGLQAIHHIGLYRLSAAIFRLRERGLRIETDMEGRNYAIYRLQK